ncbi:S4 domain-containing protein [Kitasatospora sp. NPDC004669]|uniref:S4 domain-containing protein n=1 Tax=Kitasatospora sp. NPDC004669 TaxID=3154555 RepID=UPI0033B61E07
MAEGEGSVRGSWVWWVRLTKARGLAATACWAGHVRVNGEPAKQAQSLRPGDEVRVREEVAVEVDGDCRVAQGLGDDGEGDAGGGVAQVVEADAGEAQNDGVFAELVEDPPRARR